MSDEEKLKFHIGYEGANGMWWVRCHELDYNLSFKDHDVAYHHSKLAEYEFNLIREKHSKPE